MENLRRYLLLGILPLLAVAAYGYMNRTTDAGTQNTASPQNASSSTDADAQKAQILRQQPGDIVLGKQDAPVTIVEYASLSCPHCAKFHTHVLPDLQTKYIDTGKVKLISRPYPLNEPALRAAQMVACASADQYYTFLGVLFSQQEKWAFTEDFKEQLALIGNIGGVSQEQFDRCLGDKAIENAIIDSRKQATDILGVQSTPTFFVNGQKLEGGQPLDEFARIIDPILEKSGK